MSDLFASQPAWYLAGPLLGLCVVAAYALINQRLGVVGGFSDVVERLSHRSATLGWRGFFVLGLVGGGLLFTLVSNGARADDGYGWLTREFSSTTTVGVLVLAGVLIGYGTKTAGGCTSGNGLCGNAIGSQASFVSTAIFMATAVAGSFATQWMFGA